MNARFFDSSAPPAARAGRRRTVMTKAAAARATNPLLGARGALHQDRWASEYAAQHCAAKDRRRQDPHFRSTQAAPANAAKARWGSAAAAADTAWGTTYQQTVCGDAPRRSADRATADRAAAHAGTAVGWFSTPQGLAHLNTPTPRPTMNRYAQDPNNPLPRAALPPPPDADADDSRPKAAPGSTRLRRPDSIAASRRGATPGTAAAAEDAEDGPGASKGRAGSRLHRSNSLLWGERPEAAPRPAARVQTPPGQLKNDYEVPGTTLWASHYRESFLHPEDLESKAQTDAAQVREYRESLRAAQRPTSAFKTTSSDLFPGVVAMRKREEEAAKLAKKPPALKLATSASTEAVDAAQSELASFRMTVVDNEKEEEVIV